MKKLLVSSFALALAAACTDFGAAYDRCVQEGKCIEQGRPSTATSEISISRDLALANGVDAIEIRVVLRDLGGTGVAGQTVRLEATGAGNALTQPPATDAMGVAVGKLVSTKVGQKVITASFTGSADGGETALTDAPAVRFEPGPPDSIASTLVLSKEPPGGGGTPISAAADGIDGVLATVTLVDSGGNAIPGQIVHFTASASPQDELPIPPSPPTDGAGITRTRISSTRTGTFTVRAVAASSTGQILLAQSPQVQFTAAAPSVADVTTAAPVVGGCVPVQYTLSQLQGMPTSIGVEFLGPDGNFHPATQAGGSGDGLVALRTSATGLSHTFLWNSTADLGRRTALDVQLRLTPHLRTLPGSPALARVTVKNGISYDRRVLTIFNTGTPTALAVADMNGDLKMDVVAFRKAQGSTSATLTVLLGNGDGTFRESDRAVVAGIASGADVLVADFNRDGFPDVLITNTSGLLVYLGDGAGGIPSAPTITALASGTSGIAFGDFNRDGVLDAAGVQAGTSNLAVELGLGTGAFQTPATNTALGIAANVVRAADLNGDGKLDLLVLASGAAKVLLGNGDGTFQVLSPAALGSTLSVPELADLDRDGRTDVVYRSGTNLMLARGMGNGSFSPSEIIGTTNAWSIFVADVDRDGALDVLTADYASGIRLFAGKGDGTFQMALDQVTEGDTETAVAVDTDGNGRLDLVAATHYQVVQTFLGDQPPACDPGLIGVRSLQARDMPSDVVVADFNHDGKLDVASNADSVEAVTVLLGNGSGGFSESAVIPARSDAAIVTADFNRDGRLDIAAVDRDDVSITLALGTGDGSFLATRSVLADTRALGMVAADFDGDGLLDLATVHDTGKVALMRGSTGSPSGFATPAFTSVGTDPSGIAAGDFDGDGHMDLVVTDTTTRTIYLLRNATGSTFTQAASYTVTPFPQSPIVSDFDGDGRDDFAVLVGEQVAIYRNTGTWTGFAPTSKAAGAPGQAMQRLFGVDLNGDEKVELVTTEWSNSNNVGVLVNAGDGTFGAPTLYSASRGASGVASGDLQGDGHTDLVVACLSSVTLAVMLGGGDGTLSETPWVPVPGALVGDFNGDGMPDLAGVDKIAKGRGDGTFDAPATTNAAGAVAAVVDVNRDGKLDVVSAAGGLLLVQLGNGALGLGAPTTLTLVDGGAQVVIADVNRDGWPDVLTTGGTSTIGYYRNAAGSLAAGVAINAGRSVQRLAAGDVNGDGKVDLVTVHSGNLGVWVLPGNGDGTFGAGILSGTFEAPEAVALADLNRDRKLDVVTVANLMGVPGLVSVMLGDGAGAFAAPVRYFTGILPNAITIADLDDDGALDVVTLNQGSYDISVLRGRGNGALEPEKRFAVRGACNQVSVADLNRDGRPDLVVSDGTTASVLLAR